jgi:hypothetical protein
MNDASHTRRNLILAGLAGLMAEADGAHAQDAARVMGKSYRVALENDMVRVLEFTGRPGMGVCGEGMHSHPPHLTVVLSDWKGVARSQDGSSVDRDKKVGDVFWSEAETHKVENTGRTNARVLIIELKTAPKART